MDRTTLEAFEDLIYRHSGLHFDERNRKILERGLMRRMRATRVRSHRHYLDYLRTHARSRGELKKLLALLTIGETYFFRYLAQFEGLKKTVLPELLARNRQRRSLRLWSAGCSTGEEPYSLAILLQEHFPHLADWDIDILGTDINPRSLKTAQEGLYRARALRVMDQQMVDRYFTPAGSGYRLVEAIRERVRFTHLNLQTDTYPDPSAGIEDVDVIFCRNVMIYFRPPTIKSILEGFRRSLQPQGYLFLGHSESLASITSAFSRISCEGGFFYQQREELHSADLFPEPEPPPSPPRPVIPAQPEPPPPPPAAAPTPPPKEDKPREPDTEALFRQAEKAFHQEDFETATRKYDIVLRQNPRHVGALLGKGFIHANRAEYDKARLLCREALAIDDLAVGGYFLLGLIRDLQGDAERAVEEFRKAIMLDIDFVMSHYNLGKIYQRLGRHKDARRELDNTFRILEKLPDESLIPFSGGLSREVFLEICREDREKIRA
ncbi:MAG: tetratricopeptide repeat protein [Desulfuromonadales bacterium]|nr:tetratricopeptide repeat protein [Desulfuromonadales bacterium]NIR33025.1 tetratricopeptide repeat protein [Desulfuromonadales bacterium]NIS39268.1 tetratricopeptide repeat protein [Desulfuromonadales bacterium]